jgi:methanogenic corrinoid protein MtbC1
MDCWWFIGSAPVTADNSEQTGADGFATDASSAAEKSVNCCSDKHTKHYNIL